MSIKNTLLILSLTALMAGCASMQGSDRHETTAQIGVKYLLGRGVKQDDAQAFYHFKKAANENDTFAQNEVAYLYAAGKGTPQDNEQAFLWYQKAANHGLASAEYNLGLFYLYGIGTKANRELAYLWFKKSANHGFAPAKLMLEQKH